jgi:hypothetical protein
MQRTSLKKTLVALVTLIVALFAAAPAANARVIIGIGDQQASMFDHPAFKSLKLKRVRYFVKWNAVRDPAELQRAKDFVAVARANRKKVLLHISSDNLVRRKAKLPSKSRYRRDVTKLVKTFKKLGVREFGARNEANHDSQATWRSPARAAYEFKVVRKAAGRGSAIVALDVLDQRGVGRYMKRFYRALGSYRRYATIVGIHNYSDVNRKRTTGTREIMRAGRRGNKRTKFWLTETGGVVKLASSWKCSPARAANRIKYLFKVVKRYRKQIGRVYLYSWSTHGCAGQRWDSGLVGLDGKTRPGYRVVKSQLRSRYFTR